MRQVNEGLPPFPPQVAIRSASGAPVKGRIVQTLEPAVPVQSPEK
jgi:hypothetical protein